MAIHAINAEKFNKALNAAEIETKTGAGSRKVFASFKVGGKNIEVEVVVVPKKVAPYLGYEGVDFRVLHRENAAVGTYIHWDDFGKKQVDIGFPIERYDELVKLATPTAAEVAQHHAEVLAATRGYNEEMGISPRG